MRRLLACFTLVCLAACQPAPQSYTLSPVSFRNEAPIRLNVARINVIEDYRAPLAAPNVEHQMSMPPSQAVKIWANERLQAVGSQGQLDVIITNAEVKEIKLPVKQGMRGFFTDDQSERYDAALSVNMKLYDGVSAMSRADGSVNVTRSRSVNEKATLADREKLWHDMSTEIARSFNNEAENRLRQYFSTYLR